ncbi:MAG: site-specific DNA-methyltransferase [Rhizobiaceae bacterium]|nr:site-specific DNA-methyltransferase [Rhizobiaceae bacterium]MCV0405889.1 site-specific DNA-methyltransferase [Rhizobiaceae bacterium]
MNKLFFGDNLHVLKNEIGDNSIDLVYLDPPFNSKAQYNVFYETPDNEKATAQRTVFRDTWAWEDEAQSAYQEILSAGGPTAAIVNALRNSLGRSDTMAYLVMMTVRLRQLYRALKPTGSLYLHCDPTAAHYIKIILDAVFGAQNFRSEVIWKRTGAHGRAKRWGPVHDNIFFYSVSEHYTWNRTYEEYDREYVEKFYNKEDAFGRFQAITLDGPGKRGGSSGAQWRGVNPTEKGRHWELPPDRSLPSWFVKPIGYDKMNVQERLDLLDAAGLIAWPDKGTNPRFKRYLSVSEGNPVQDVITDIGPLSSHAKERVGYPTQKPVALLERIIKASSNKGDVVLDPFCGCGTTVHAAENLNRQWIGIDVSYYAIRLISRRLRSVVGPGKLKIGGIPADYTSAEALADRDPYGFQQWIVGELGCQLWNDGKKGSDRGIDGEMYFMNGPGPAGRLLVQVKGGKHTGPRDLRDFAWVLNRENAEMGLFVCRNQPTKEMRGEAAELGVHRIGSTTYPRLRIVDMASWFAGQRPQMPVAIEMRPVTDKSVPKPKRSRRPDPRQPQFSYVFTGGIEKAAEDGQVFNPDILPDEAAGVVRRKSA